MTGTNCILYTLQCTLMLAAAPAGTAAADIGDFRVAFGSVQGIELIEAGHYAEAIDLLEERQERQDIVPEPDELSTLCALYVLVRDVDGGRDTCDKAVEQNPSESAYNNRGVYRVYTGDIAGALRDFTRVRVTPPEMPRFLDDLQRRNPRLMASNNFALIRTVTKRKHEPAPVAGGAKVEDVLR